jgi:hypothetical protein
MHTEIFHGRIGGKRPTRHLYSPVPFSLLFVLVLCSILVFDSQGMMKITDGGIIISIALGRKEEVRATAASTHSTQNQIPTGRQRLLKLHS